MDKTTVAFSGEVQLAGWINSHDGGFKVTFWVQDVVDAEQLKIMTARKGKDAGQRLMLSAVQIGDDELPVTQPQPPPKPKGGAPSKLAAIWCGQEVFQNFVKAQFGATWVLAEEAIACGSNDELARWVVRFKGMVESLAEFDQSHEAGARFNQLFRVPFSDLLRGEA